LAALLRWMLDLGIVYSDPDEFLPRMRLRNM
jgi:hypothetical protein